MSDFQEVAQDLSDALPGVPEKLTQLSEAAERLEAVNSTLGELLDRIEAEAEAQVKEIGETLWAVGDASSEEHARYEELVDDVTQPLIISSEAQPYGIGMATGAAIRAQVPILKLLPVQVRTLIEGRDEALAELRTHLGEVQESLAEAGRQVREEQEKAHQAMEEASQALREAVGQLSEGVETGQREMEETAEAFEQAVSAGGTEFEQRMASLARTLVDAGDGLKADVEGATRAMSGRLEDAYGELGAALEGLRAHLEALGGEAGEVHGTLSPLFPALEALLHPLQAGIEAAKEGARRVGLPV